jgi:hypothetical protein
VFAGLPGTGISSAGPIGIPSTSPTPDLTTVPQMTLQEATKNAAKTYQIGDRINLLTEINSPTLENGDHLALKLPEGASKLEDQGWYIDPSSQFLGGVFRFIVSPIQTGALTLPTLLIQKEDGITIGRTAPYQIQVTGPEKKDQKEAELLEITSRSLPIKYWILFSLLALFVMCGVSYLVYRTLKNRRKKPTFIPKTQADPEHVVALRKINELYQTYPYEIVNLKPIAFGVSETLKEFFSKRFKIDAIESTSDEMIELLRKEAINGENLREIQTLFQDLDLVKFTKSENYSHFDQFKYQDLKVKSQLIIQKWTLKPVEPKGPQI